MLLDKEMQTWKVFPIKTPDLNMNTYQLLDSGHSNKLEQVGPYRLIRPAPQALWSPTQNTSLWENVHAIYHRSPSGGGHWDYKARLPASWTIVYHGLKLKIKLTDFGHLGLFAEQGPNWAWIQASIKQAASSINAKNAKGEREARDLNQSIKVLNTFAYTGGSTLAAATTGAKVVHVDASKGIVAWARENAAIAGLGQKPIRWIVDDVTKFVKRELRRGNRYDALILDPPSFGRGSKGEIWKFEQDLPKLLDLCRGLLSQRPCFVLLSAHTPGFTPLALENLLAEMMGAYGGQLDSQEMVIPYQQGRVLPSGTMAQWWQVDPNSTL